MTNDIIDMIEQTPKLHSFKCKAVSYIIWVFLKFTTYIATLVVWYIYDYFIAFFTFILSFIVVGIIRSKMRNSAIPLKQQEYQYNDKGIADWFSAREICVGYDN
ncbi:hypothetical protein FJR48_06945 [Sulfurimonas lithotrophica]|uniref:Uncharacterized protein n=1 Tax=Sulfurimonas lithotrophica TaxID=2590022 RepID=A0A5P8P1H1_9BACT|nr:hypothetical protein [Sulfurimonas lithotrophica]QFR49480.1 hypothetical protein FJR48_06945 [Sulfurimonas lithotrophica]